jgi:sugar phosphate isomerase/epimerase
MAENFENFYPGTPSAFDYPAFQSLDYGDLFTGYRVRFQDIGMTTDPRTNNLIEEVSKKLSSGVKTIEMTGLQMGEGPPSQFLETIPKQHFKEVERISKLTGAEVTMHGPLVELSGLSRNGWSQEMREDSERQIVNAIDRAHEMNPRGGVPVTLHASTMPAYEWKPGMPEDKATIIAIDQQSMQQHPLRYEMRYTPGEPKTHEWTPQAQVESLNATHWHNKVTEMISAKQGADNLIKDSWHIVAPIWKKIDNGEISFNQLSPGQQQAYVNIQNAQNLYADKIDPAFVTLYDEAYKYAPKLIEGITREGKEVRISKEDYREMLTDVGNKYNKLREEKNITPSKMSFEYGKILSGLAHLPAPQHYIPVEEFSKKHSSTTLANAALKTYMKYGENSPTISVENVTPDMAFSRSESLKGLIEEARKKFVEQAKKKGIGGGDAKKIAEKLIGATWDIGHINLLRKYGYDEAKLREETKEIAPFVKHVHISDNFGSEHIELPPGMGTVPIKDLLKELEKQGYSGKKILEVAHWWQNLSQQGKISPLPYSMEALGSPIYGMMQAPYWNQARGVYGQYISGPLAYMPEQHHAMYGSGLMSLPTELGGQIPGKQSRLAGAPNE